MLLVPIFPHWQAHHKSGKDTTTKQVLEVQSIHPQCTLQAFARSSPNHTTSFIAWSEKQIHEQTKNTFSTSEDADIMQDYLAWPGSNVSYNFSAPSLRRHVLQPWNSSIHHVRWSTRSTFSYRRNLTVRYLNLQGRFFLIKAKYNSAKPKGLD